MKPLGLGKMTDKSIEKTYKENLEENIVQFWVNLVRPKIMAEENHQYDAYITLSFGNPELYFGDDKVRCTLGLKNIQLHIEGDILNSKVFKNCNELNSNNNYIIEVVTNEGKSKSLTSNVQSTLGVSQYTRAKFTSKLENKNTTESSRKFGVQMTRGEFKVHTPKRKKQVWTVSAPTGFVLNSYSPEKYTEIISHNVEFWISILPSYWDYGNEIDCLPPVKKQLVKYIISSEYRDLILNMQAKRKQIEDTLTKNWNLIIRPLEIRYE